jgi:hypothetical protein
MQENYVQKDMSTIEEKAQPEQATKPRRRIVKEQPQVRRLEQQVLDLSGVDFTRPEVKESVTRAANRLIEIAQKRRRLGGD